MADAAVGVAELRDVRPPTGSAPTQPAARTARYAPLNGTSYELVDQSGGGGGGGTDDQTAAEVPVTATGFSGNLGSTDTDVQDGSQYHRRIHARRWEAAALGQHRWWRSNARLTDVASASYASDTQILECEATPSINEGTFVVEDASGTDTTDRVVIPRGRPV